MKNFKTFTKISTLTLLVSTNLAFANDMVILPFFMEVKSRIQATRNKCCFGVYPPNAILGLS